MANKCYMIEDKGSMDKWHVIDIIESNDPGKDCLKYRSILENDKIYQTPNIKGYVIV